MKNIAALLSSRRLRTPDGPKAKQYQAKRQEFVQEHKTVFIDSLKFSDPTKLNVLPSFGYAAFMNSASLVNIGASPTQWNDLMLPTYGIFAEKPLNAMNNSDYAHLTSTGAEALAPLTIEPPPETFDQMRSFHENPVVKRLMRDMGLYTTGGILMEKNWSLLGNIAYIDGSICSGQTFQVSAANMPLAELPNAHPDLIWDAREGRYRVAGIEIMQICLSDSSSQLDLGGGSPLLLKTAKSDELPDLRKILERIKQADGKSKDYAFDQFKDVVSGVKKSDTW